MARIVKYDDIARKLNGKEEEMARSEERGHMCETKIIDLEEELRVVGQNLQQLEVCYGNGSRPRDRKTRGLGQCLHSIRTDLGQVIYHIHTVFFPFLWRG